MDKNYFKTKETLGPITKYTILVPIKDEELPAIKTIPGENSDGIFKIIRVSEDEYLSSNRKHKEEVIQESYVPYKAIERIIEEMDKANIEIQENDYNFTNEELIDYAELLSLYNNEFMAIVPIMATQATDVDLETRIAAKEYFSKINNSHPNSNLKRTISKAFEMKKKDLGIEDLNRMITAEFKAISKASPSIKQNEMRNRIVSESKLNRWERLPSEMDN